MPSSHSKCEEEEEEALAPVEDGADGKSSKFYDVYGPQVLSSFQFVPLFSTSSLLGFATKFEC